MTPDDPETEMGERFCATITRDGQIIAGLAVLLDGKVALITWPDGEQNERVELPIGQGYPR